MAAAREFLIGSSALVVLATWGADKMLSPSAGGAFVLGQAQKPQLPAHAAAETARAIAADVPPRAASAREALGVRGLLAYGAGFGALAAIARGTARPKARAAARKVARAAADIEVAEKSKTEVVAYLKDVPRTIVEKGTIEKLLASLPREQWEDPPEDHPLYVLKIYAETYGPGKATKMGWWDFWYMRLTLPDAEEVEDVYTDNPEDKLEWEAMMRGETQLGVPGPAGVFYTGATIKWRGPEPFAGDQVQTPVTSGRFAKQFLDNLAFYREGLQPWQRGLEIGMAHGYFIIGPFVSLGPLRNTPEAATVGLLAGCALIGIVSVGGLLFGATIAPKRFDKPGAPRASGFQEMINWHAVGGLGGAGFAHALITVFGSS